MPSKNESKKVTINYTIKGAVDKYNDNASRFNGFEISNYEFYGGSLSKISKENGVIKCDKEYLDSNILENIYPLDTEADSPINNALQRGGIVIKGWIVSAIMIILVLISFGHNIYLALTGRVNEVRFGNSGGFDDFGSSDFGGGGDSGGSSSSGGF